MCLNEFKYDMFHDMTYIICLIEYIVPYRIDLLMLYIFTFYISYIMTMCLIFYV